MMHRRWVDRTTGNERGGVALSLAIQLIAILLLSQPVRADDLYRAQTIVTGQFEPNRSIGFAVCLEDVLIKVSGALQLAGDSRLAPYKARAAEFVTGFDYHDQMTGTPKRDEQGTRDRPYDLIVDFNKAKIDDLLGMLGLKPWASHRPLLGVIVAMAPGGRTYIVTADGRQSELQREALRAAALKRGVSIVLPDSAALAQIKIEAADVIKTSSADLAAALSRQGAEAILIGQLSWDDDALGWSTEWRLDVDGQPHRWHLAGVTFDEAFRRGLGGAAQILSGNGAPQ
ncbi:conserved exported hypothetical protein [Bradyrhizobium sp. STM 3843]|uniref:DUF2066 domain-containing protein n=1 Tax=Bradyrhizobium sp. STM 3843 TaxID=551947 RepID=UPI000240B0E2|nr:DUF2066 domain-containing protein [Bradyrhizobium sp. STM 3843]CCE07552.1 conserved exported hypothetical protein [Bradyrhizobium sp. STM 3843]